MRLVLPPLLLLAGGVVASVALAPVPAASAKASFSQRENKPCSYCHINPMGGGARNPKGEEYQRNGFKFPPTVKKGGFGEDEAFKNQANADQFGFVRAAMQIEHWSEALRRIADLKGKEDKKGAGYQKVINVESMVDGKGRDLLRAARESIEQGKVADAAAALARLESEFRGREPAKDVAKWRAELGKLPGGKEADAKAKADQPLRLMWLDAQMRLIEGHEDLAIKAAEALLAKSPDGPFSADAKGMLEELKKAQAAEAGMGG